MDEVHRLADYRMRLTHEGGNAEFGREDRLTVKEITPCEGTEEAVMVREDGGNLVIEMGALRQHNAAITIFQPSRRIGCGPDYLLQAEDVGIHICQIVDQWRVDAAAPGIQ